MKLWAACLLALTVLACGRAPVRNYYTLTYETPAKRAETPADVMVRVRKVKVRESYRRTELVHRYDVHEMRYFRSRRWSEPPEKMLTTLLTEHLRAAGVAKQVTSSIGQTEPDYSVQAELEAMEEQIAGPNRYARLAMRLTLVRGTDDAVVWRHRFDERRPVGGESARGTVRAISHIFSREMDRAIDDMGRFLEDPGGYFPDTEKPVEQAGDAVGPEVVRADLESPLLDLPQVLKDDTPMPVGFGAVFLPSPMDGDREPVVAVSRQGEEKLLSEGQMGRRIVLSPGVYSFRFGSGAGNQQLNVDAEVVAGRTTVVPPTWGGLEVDVRDSSFVPFRGTYELFRMENQDNFGLGLGADALSGESTRVWVLPPGLYKIVRSGSTYTARTDFATVRVSEGEVRRFVLVQNEDSGEFEGAGEVDPTQARGEDTHWSGTAVIDGSILFNRTNEVTEEEGWTLGLGLRLLGSSRYEDSDQQWDTTLDIEEVQERPPESKDEFTKAIDSKTDRFFVHSIYTYLLVPWFGPYAQGRSETTLLPKYTGDPGERRRLSDSFAPWKLRQGAGGNFRVVRRSDIELDVRAGMGARQFLARGLLRQDGDALVEVPDDLVEGPELAVVLLGRITRWVTLSSDFDGLFPFDELQQPRFEWHNQVSLRLASFVSLAYRLNVFGDPNLGLDEDFQVEHDVQLRFSYVVF